MAHPPAALRRARLRAGPELARGASSSRCRRRSKGGIGILVDAAARNALVRKRDGRLVVVDGSLITGTQLRFRVACARVLDAAAALLVSSSARRICPSSARSASRAPHAGALRRSIKRPATIGECLTMLLLPCRFEKPTV